MTREHLTDLDLTKIADDISNHITIRTYDEYGSHDVTRETSKAEKDIVENLAYASLLAYRFAEDASIADILCTAEFALHQFIPTANSYDTIYLPIKRALELL